MAIICESSQFRAYTFSGKRDQQVNEARFGGLKTALSTVFRRPQAQNTLPFRLQGARTFGFRVIGFLHKRVITFGVRVVPPSERGCEHSNAEGDIPLNPRGVSP